MLDFNFHITTPRLTLSYLDPSNAKHVDFIYELNNTPEMLATNRNLPNPYTNHEAALEFIKPNIKSLEKTGYGKFLISPHPILHSMHEISPLHNSLTPTSSSASYLSRPNVIHLRRLSQTSGLRS
jgi:hypothetical protein